MYTTCTMLPVEGAELHTTVCLPAPEGKFPIVLLRSPYVDAEENMTDTEIADRAAEANKVWLEAGYAVVSQHCRGRGRSTGDCIPYIYEREDGLALQAWVREQPFYAGELYLFGRSYTSSVHYVTAPFAPDIKAAVREVQDCERYNCNYRNGFYKMGLHGGWYVNSMYKKKSHLAKAYVPESYNLLPLRDFSRTVLGEPAPDFDAILAHPDRHDPFWQTRYGGGEAHDAIKHANIPILLVTGFYDIYTGGIFDMWNGLDDATRRQSALLVSPYDHGGTEKSQPVAFPQGRADEAFGNYRLRWFEYVRGRGDAPIKPGEVTYYDIFGDGWRTDTFAQPTTTRRFPLGEGERSYRYNPFAPAKFKGGLSANFGGTAYQDPPDSRYDILSFHTPAFAELTRIKGRMTASLTVRSSCPDTCFYIRLSLCIPDGDYGLRDDIHALSTFAPDYHPGDEVTLSFTFDEHAFTIQPGQRLRIDISSSAFPHYVRHTNRRGPFAEQTGADVAANTILCDRSYLELPIES